MQYFSKDLEVLKNGSVTLSFFTDLTTLEEVEELYIYTPQSLRRAVTSKNAMLSPYNKWDGERKSAEAEISKTQEMKYKLLRGESLLRKVKNTEQHVAYIEQSILDRELPVFSGVSILKVGNDFNDYYVRGRFLCSKKNLRILYAMVIFLRDNNLFKVLDGLAKGTAEDGAYYEMLREVVIPFNAFMTLAANKFAFLLDLQSVIDYDYAYMNESHFFLPTDELETLINKGYQFNDVILKNLK